MNETAPIRAAGLPAVDFGWTTFIWTGNWSFLSVRGWMYRGMAVLVGLSLCGAGRLAWKRRADIAILAAFLTCFALACIYLGMASFAAGASPGASGWYACCLSAPFAVLAGAGLRAVLPGRPQHLAIPLFAAAFSAIDLFGTHFYSLPYYTGLIWHTPAGGLPACGIARFAHGGFGLMWQRLTLAKPAWVSVPVLICLWLLFLAATAVAIAVSIRARHLEPGARQLRASERVCSILR